MDGPISSGGADPRPESKTDAEELTPTATTERATSAAASGEGGLERLHERLAAGLPAVARPLLADALARAERLNAGAGYGEDGLRIAASSLASEAVVALAVEGVL
jgi:hypothetical protein